MIMASYTRYGDYGEGRLSSEEAGISKTNFNE